MKILKYPLIALIIGVLLFGCDKDPEDPIIPNEEEVITTLTLTLTPVGGGTNKVFIFKDLDGAGGNVATVTADSLTAGTVYNATIVLLNEQESPAGNITTEVLAEAVEHQFFYSANPSGVTITYKDQDANGKPLGIKTELTTSTAQSAMLKVVLRHEPSKDAQGVASGDITNAGGETDIEVNFNLEVQ